MKNGRGLTCFTVVLIFFWSLAVNCNAGEILLLSEEVPPFQYTSAEGTIGGFGIELVTEIFSTAGVTVKNNKIHIYPWTRAYLLLQKKTNSAAFMTVRNKEREKMFKWVGPLAPREMWLFKLRSREDIRITTLEEAKAYKVGGYRSAQTDSLVQLGFSNLQIVPNESQNIKLLTSGRVDLIPALEMTMALRLKQSGLPFNTVEKTVLLDGRFDYYLALNLSIPDTVVNRLQQALDVLKENGTYDRLHDKYLH
ncbi:MAG: transporter substrate-binding domain-containing protein [Desulfobacterales bacterium]|nr:transporter substrate-binding domain-containing protein [Desulfobacterales bacterium]